MTFFALTARPQQANTSQTLHGHVPGAITRLHLRPLGNFAVTNTLGLAVSLPLRNETGLSTLLQQIYDPTSPNYHHYLTPEQFTAQFGPAEQDYDAVVAFLKANGLVVTTHPNRTLVDASGDVATINKAFHLTLRVYQHPTENRTFYAPDTDPVISPGVPIGHIIGLDNFVIPQPLSKRMHWNGNSIGVKAAYGTGSGTNGEYMGKDFREAYVPGVTLDGAGQSVGLFELDGFYSNDIVAYENLAGFPKTPFTIVSVNGGVRRVGSGDGEVSLDIEMAISMATNLSSVLVYEAPNGNANSTVDLLSRITSDNLAKQISSSWLIGDNTNYDTYYQEMAAQGQSFFQASGDDGAFYSGISEWADDTNITLVGGTTLNTTGSGGAWVSETAWNWSITLPPNVGATGGGITFSNVPIPAYQLGISMASNQGSTTLRNVPDVALTADDIFVYYNKGNFNEQDFSAGTSCAAPLWAGFTALVNQQAANNGQPPVGFLNPAIYAIGKSANYANCFHDITTGNNTNTIVGTSEWYAVPGYDLCTGWGTPNGQNLINALVPPPSVPFSITPSTGINATGFAGGPFAPNSQVYVLTNSTASPVKWALANNASWLSASATAGTLAASSATDVTLSVSASANSLAAATYNATVTFTNSTTITPDSLPFSLQVNEPLVIAPAAGFAASVAVEGGPFSATSQLFDLTNIGPASLTWQATSPSWINLLPSSGTLDGGQSTTVTASLSGSVGSLLTGTYAGQASFTDEPGATVQNRPFSLTIGQNIVQNGGFETGDFTDWTLNTNGFGTVVDNGSTTGILPQSGTYFAALGQSGSVGFVSQTLPTTDNQSYLLSLWFNSPDVTTIALAQADGVTSNTPNQFIVSWNGTTLFNQTNIPPISGWTNLQFVVMATSPSTVLQFGGMADPWVLGLDNINVWPIPTLNIRNASFAANQVFSLTWNALSNITYEVECTTNLASTNWNIVNVYTAANPVLTVTNPIGTNGYMFYRVIGLP